MAYGGVLFILTPSLAVASAAVDAVMVAAVVEVLEKKGLRVCGVKFCSCGSWAATDDRT